MYNCTKQYDTIYSPHIHARAFLPSMSYTNKSVPEIFASIQIFYRYGTVPYLPSEITEYQNLSSISHNLNDPTKKQAIEKYTHYIYNE